DAGLRRRRPHCPGHRRPGRTLCRDTGPDRGRRWLFRRPACVRRRRPAQGEQARSRALPQGWRAPAPLPHRTADERRLGVHAWPGDHGRRVHRRPEGRRRRHQQGQGLRRRHEEAQLQRPVELARHPAQAPFARFHRRLRDPEPGVQGHEDGRSYGWPAHHDAEPDGARGRHRGKPDPRQGRRSRCRGPDGLRPYRSEGWCRMTAVTIAGTSRTVELPAEVFDVQVNIPLIHQVVVAQLAAARQGTPDAKTRGEVSGGGRKPYRQKGTGRARQGSTRAPQFAGGGVAHGPNPRNYEQRTPKKMKAAALRGALSDRARGGRVHVLPGFGEGEAPSTKSALAALAAVVTGDQHRVLVVLERADDLTWKSLRNVGGVHLLVEDQLNTYDVLVSEDVVFTEGALRTYVKRATGAAAVEEDAT